MLVISCTMVRPWNGNFQCIRYNLYVTLKVHLVRHCQEQVVRLLKYQPNLGKFRTHPEGFTGQLNTRSHFEGLFEVHIYKTTRQLSIFRCSAGLLSLPSSARCILYSGYEICFFDSCWHQFFPYLSFGISVVHTFMGNSGKPSLVTCKGQRRQILCVLMAMIGQNHLFGMIFFNGWCEETPLHQKCPVHFCLQELLHGIFQEMHH